MMMKMMMMCAVAAVSNAGSKSTYAGITPTHVPTVYVNSDEQDLLSHINTVPGFYFSLTFICAEYILKIRTDVSPPIDAKISQISLAEAEL